MSPSRVFPVSFPVLVTGGFLVDCGDATPTSSAGPDLDRTAAEAAGVEIVHAVID